MEAEPGKLFVGGISQETTEETLKDYFGTYGGVKESGIIRDRNTSNGRGFGFVTFKDPSVVNNVLRDEHIILRRTVRLVDHFYLYRVFLLWVFFPFYLDTLFLLLWFCFFPFLNLFNSIVFDYIGRCERSHTQR